MNAEFLKRYSTEKRSNHSSTTMNRTGGIQRRAILKTAWAGFCAFALWLTNSMVRRAGNLPENSQATLTVPLSTGESIRFFDGAIVIHSNSGVAVYSSRCTHLGCRINRAEGNELVCPCHGSRFYLDGGVAHGPATHALQPLQYEIDNSASVLRISLTQ